jgi:hypothetical protein
MLLAQFGSVLLACGRRDDAANVIDEALRWWVEQLNQPDLIDQFIARI